MKKLELVLYPDSGLREKCQPVSQMSDRIDKLIDDMFYTMYEAPGIGLAAPQIAVPERIIVVDVSEDKTQPLALINPEIIATKGEISWEEGCLSLPGVYGEVKRPRHIKIRAMNRDGEALEMLADDLLAVCIQHEVDHLNGVLFTDHLSTLKRTRLLHKFKKLQTAERSHT